MNRLRGFRQTFDERLFALPPGRLWDLVRVGAAINDLDYAVTESLTDTLPCFRAALIFHRVVQQGGDGFILVTAMLDHRRAHGKKM